MSYEKISTTKEASPFVRSGWINFLDDQELTHGLTFQWNKAMSQVAALSDIKHFHGMIDRRLLGPRYLQKPDRSFAVFIFEGDENRNLHCHSLWRISPERKAQFEGLVSQSQDRHSLWKQIAPAGSCVLRINGPLNGDGIAAAIYLTKEIEMRSTDRIVFSNTFLPSH
jgi:hypothetical protein